MSPLSFDIRLGLAKSGLLPESDIRDLIIEAVTTHRTLYLPPEVAKYGQELARQGKITLPPSN